MTLGIEWGAGEAPPKEKDSSSKYWSYLLFKYFYDEVSHSSTELLVNALYPVNKYVAQPRGHFTPLPRSNQLLEFSVKDSLNFIGSFLGIDVSFNPSVSFDRGVYL